VKTAKHLVDTETIYYIVNEAEELRMYLFQPDIGFTGEQAGKAFDLIDVVLINGDYQNRPWSRENLEVE
jgi:hypothetical protein